jgi:hypothetical protein
VVCLSRNLHDVFERLATDILNEIAEAPSPASKAVEVLNRWKELLSSASQRNVLTDEKIVGLMAELMCARDIARRDALRRLDSWTGPAGHQHDFFVGDVALEVKASTGREGRLVSISSIAQLDEAPGSKLYLAYHRFEPAKESQGSSLLEEVEATRDIGVDEAELNRRLAAVGFSYLDVDHYLDRRFVLKERRIYNVLGHAFPRITVSSFVNGVVPPGTLRLTYSIDLTNEPPLPLTEAEVNQLWATCAK